MSEAIYPSDTGVRPERLCVVQQKIESPRYGVVQLVVHDGWMTQIERAEKTRLTDPDFPGRRSATS